MTEELRHIIPATSESRLGNIERDLHYVKQQNTQIIQALGAEQLRAPGLAPGMLQRQDSQESHMSDHEERITILENKRDAAKLVVLNVLTAVMGGSLTAWVAIHLVK